MTKNLRSKIFNLKSEWTWVISLGIGIILTFFFFRLINLTILPIFADEAIYIRWSQVMRAEPTLRFLPLSDGKQPLFMWLTMPFLKIFADPLFAGRFLAVVCGFVSLGGIFLLSWELFKNKRLALISSLFYAILPFFVFFDRQALVDSMLMMFGIWLAYLGLILVRYPRLDLAMIMGIVLGGALLTKSPAIFLAILLPTTLLFYPLKITKKIDKKIHVRNFVAILGLWVVVYLFGFGIYNFLLRLGPGLQMIAIRNKDYVFTFKEILSHPLDPLKPHLSDLASWLPNLLTWPVFLLGLMGIFLGLKRKSKEVFYLLCWFVIPVFIQSIFAKVFTPRYILFAIWPLIIIAAFSLDWLFNQLKYCLRIVRGSLAIAIFLLIVGLPGLKYSWLLITNPEKAPLPRNLRSGHLEEWTAGQGIKEAAEYLKERAKTTNILVGTEGFFGTLPDGLQIYLEKIPRLTVIGVGWPVSGVPEGLINALKDNEVYLLVNQSRFLISPPSPGLKLIREYLKAVTPKEDRDKLLLFELTKSYWR